MENVDRIMTIMLMIGAAGALLGIYLTPRKGSETRHNIETNAKSFPKAKGDKAIGEVKKEEEQKKDNKIDKEPSESYHQRAYQVQGTKRPSGLISYDPEDPMN
jgi:gas vesicle protein